MRAGRRPDVTASTVRGVWVRDPTSPRDDSRHEPSSATDRRSDAQLLADSARDLTSFSVLYERWAARLLSYFYQRTWDPEASADLVAETFAVAFAKRAAYVRTGAPGGAWLYGIASRELRRYRRKQRVELRALSRLGVERPPINDASIARIEARDEIASWRDRLTRAVGNLNDADRRLIQLRVIDGLAFQEVGRQLGCSEGAARVRLHRVLNRLARTMGVPRNE